VNRVLALLRSRRVILPAIVLIVGLSIALWAARGERERRDALQATFTVVCEDAAAGREVASRLTTAPPLRARDVARRVQSACGDVSPGDLAVEIFGSDEPAPGDRHEGRAHDDATHVVVIHARGEPRLTLRVRVGDDGATIVGYSVVSLE